EKRRAKRDDRREKRRQQRSNKEEESELMYEMEEGHKDSTDSSGNSSEVDRANYGDFTAPRTPRVFRLGKVAAVYIVILLAFATLLYGAYRASSHKPHAKHIPQTLSNGTSTFAPTTIYISLDGFRADFLHRNITPSLNAFVQDGISPKWMLPSFPSVTFPNHFTLVTGLYPEAHGVVGNTFWDPTLKEEFYYTDPAHSMQPKWWLGEPIWETAESQGSRAAIHMWPGSEAHIGDIEPTYVDKYNGKELLSNKVNRILGLLDLPGHDDIGANSDTPRPQLIAAYIPNVDQHGHLYGPNSTEIRADISSVDTMLGDLFQGLEDRNLTDIVNIVIVSDHGMASTDISRLIQLDDIIDINLIEHTDGWPLYGLRPSNEADLEPLYHRLKQEASGSGNYEVYLRDRDMPERYHFSKNERIAPLWIIPKTGWAIVTKEEFDVEKGRREGLVYHPRGLHGYDHEHPLMRAIFIARGPAFPHTPGSKMEVFQNIEVYNIVCDSLGITPKPNNGTLRLPLKPTGLHSEDLPEEIPDNPELPEHSPTSEPARQSVSSETPTTTESFASPDPQKTPDTLETSETLDIPDTLTASDVSEPIEPPADTRPVVQDGGDPEDEQVNYWWDWVKGKLDGAKDW
ncbi:alkaline-phosphatase-like protein, partial [Delphinella strobiligena]